MDASATKSTRPSRAKKAPVAALGAEADSGSASPADLVTLPSTKKRATKAAAVLSDDDDPEASSPSDSSCESPERKWKPSSRKTKGATAGLGAPGKKTKKARQLLKAHMTSGGVAADLSTHALARLLVSTPAIFTLFSTRDIRHLRRADKTLRSLVAEHAWADSSTPVPRLLAEWRSSFSAAIACRLDSPTLTKGQLALLKDLTSFTSVGFRSKSEDSEQPLAVVRTIPHLESLTVASRRGAALASTAAVWGELGHLREISLELAAIPVNLLSRLNGAVLRKLFLRIDDKYMSGRSGGGLITDAALASLPLLEELLLDGVLPIEDVRQGPAAFTGTSFAMLSRLASLTICNATLPASIVSYAPASLRALTLSRCSGLTDASFSAPCFSGITSLNLASSTTGITSEAFAGLAALEELTLHVTLGDDIFKDAALAVLGSHGRLRRLHCFSELKYEDRHKTMSFTGIGLHAFARCPLEVLKLSGPGNCRLPERGALHGAIAQARTLSLCCDGYSAKFLESLVHAVTLDLHGSKHLTDVNLWSLRGLRTVDFSACKRVTIGTIFCLPPCITSLSLGECEHLGIDDVFLERIGISFPALEHLSLFKTLVSEVNPEHRTRSLALKRIAASHRHGALLALPAAAFPISTKGKGVDDGKPSHQSSSTGSSDEAGGDAGDDDSGDDESDDSTAGARGAAPPNKVAGGRLPSAAVYVDPSVPSWMMVYHAQRAAEAKVLCETVPSHTSAVGWAALLRGLPHGLLFSLDVRGCILSYASYALLLERVSELRAAKVMSPEAVAAADVRRTAKYAAATAARAEAMSVAEDEAGAGVGVGQAGGW